MVPMNFVTLMKLLFSCNCPAVGDKSGKSVHIIGEGPYRVILLNYLCYQFALISREYLLYSGAKALPTFCCVCV
jgi:hypothetical protein